MASNSIFNHLLLFHASFFTFPSHPAINCSSTPVLRRFLPFTCLPEQFLCKFLTWNRFEPFSMAPHWILKDSVLFWAFSKPEAIKNAFEALLGARKLGLSASKLLLMASNGSKRLKISPNAFKSLQTACNNLTLLPPEPLTVCTSSQSQRIN